MSNKSPSHVSTILRGALGFIALGSMFSVGCASPDQIDAEGPEVAVSSQALKEHYDGETLLRGIFFGRGPVAKLLPEIWQKAPLTQEDAAASFREGMSDLQHGADLAKADEAVLEAIKKNETKKGEGADEAATLAITLLTKQDPKFAAFFEKSIYSGDPVLVSDAIEEAAKRFHELMELEIILDVGRYGADWVINDNVAINTNAVLNVNVAVNVDTAYNKTQFWSLTLDRASQLRNEMMVATLTARFAR